MGTLSKSRDIPEGNRVSPRGTESGLEPAVDQFPPKQTQPFVDVGFGPLTMSPPGLAELSGVVCGSNLEGVAGDAATKDAERPARVKIRSHNQDRASTHVSDTFGGVGGLGFRRTSIDGTYRDKRGLRLRVCPSSGQFHVGCAIGAGVGGNIKDDAPCIALAEQFQGAGGPTIGLPCENQDGVRLVRLVDNQELT